MVLTSFVSRKVPVQGSKVTMACARHARTSVCARRYLEEVEDELPNEQALNEEGWPLPSPVLLARLQAARLHELVFFCSRQSACCDPAVDKQRQSAD